MFIAAVIIIVWTIAATGALGVNGNATSLLQALAVSPIFIRPERSLIVLFRRPIDF